MSTKGIGASNQKKHIIYIALVTASILLVPLVAMQFTDEVDWGFGDFIIMGILIFGAGLVYEMVTRRISDVTHRIAVGVVLAVLFFLVWAELAVGIFGSPLAGS